MELINVSPMCAGSTMAVDPSGREQLVVAIKGTFNIPKTPGARPALSDEQVPLVLADMFDGEPGLAAPTYETDFAPEKSSCDILLLGSAYAPGGRPTQQVQVALQVGTLVKSFQVVGDRHWVGSAAGARASQPEPFKVLPISYGGAFGGVDESDPDQRAAFISNPVGRGFCKRQDAVWLDGRPLPNNQDASDPVTHPNGNYVPKAFGPIGRGWRGRIEFAGTYDEEWMQGTFPFLPADFDKRYYQAAPLDQQLPIPNGPLEVVLINLTPDGRRHFGVPYFDAPIHVFPRQGARERHTAQLDTIVFEPDRERFTLTWRLCRPLKRDLFDIIQVQVGGKGREGWARRSEIGAAVPTAPVAAS